MLTGERYCLADPILGVTNAQGRRLTANIPAGSIIEVVGEDPIYHETMIDVVWQGEIMAVFSEDIESRGKKLG